MDTSSKTKTPWELIEMKCGFDFICDTFNGFLNKLIGLLKYLKLLKSDFSYKHWSLGRYFFK